MKDKKRSQNSGSQVVPNVPSTSTNSNPQESTMSKSETETKMPETSNVKNIKATLRGFDLSNLKPVQKEIEVSFTPAATPQDAIARLGNDPVKILAVLNDALESKTVAEAKTSALPSGFASKKTVLDFVKNLRMVPTFASLVKKEKGQAGWKEEYNAQTDAILSQIVNVQFMMDNLRAIAAVAPADDSEDEAE